MEVTLIVSKREGTYQCKRTLDERPVMKQMEEMVNDLTALMRSGVKMGRKILPCNPEPHWLFLKAFADELDRAPRYGSQDIDIPEGERYIQISDTLAKEITRQIREAAAGKEGPRREYLKEPYHTRIVGELRELLIRGHVTKEEILAALGITE